MLYHFILYLIAKVNHSLVPFLISLKNNYDIKFCLGYNNPYFLFTIFIQINSDAYTEIKNHLINSSRLRADTQTLSFLLYHACTCQIVFQLAMECFFSFFRKVWINDFNFKPYCHSCNTTIISNIYLTAFKYMK